MSVIQITSVLVCIASSVVGNSPAEKVALRWRDHYEVAKNVAQAAEHPLLVVLENPTKTTEKIDETKLNEQDRQTIATQEFELVRVDVNTDYGKRVAAAFGATKFPYTAVTDDRSVNIVYRKAGQMSERDWTVALAKSKQTEIQVVQAAKQIVYPQPVATDFGNQVFGGQFFPQGVITSPISCGVGGT
jgi:hypothetical protein